MLGALHAYIAYLLLRLLDGGGAAGWARQAGRCVVGVVTLPINARVRGGGQLRRVDG